jgi:tRNA A37 methylthiotransferase MiaB
VIPGVGLSSDFISGFCGETEEDHALTVRLLEEVGYDQAFMFAYSRRERTHAAHRLQDDVPPEVGTGNGPRPPAYPRVGWWRETC